LLIGTNDHRTYLSVPSKQQGFQAAHLALLIWLALPTGKQITGQSSQANKVGFGTAAGIYGNGMGVQSIVPNDTVTTTVVGRTAYVCMLAQDGITASYQVTVDGRDFGTYNTGTAAAMATLNGRSYGPRLLRFGGLSDGPHTVVVKVITASTNNPVYFLWAAATSGANRQGGPRVTVGSIPRFTAAGYTASGGSDTTVRQFNDLIVQNVRALQEDGLNVALADVAGYIDPASMLGGDGVHPNDNGHATVRDAFLQAMNEVSYPSERFAPGGRMPLMVGCRLRMTAAYNVPAGSLTPIPWDTEDFDTQGFHDPGTNPSRMTVPAGQAGYYRVDGCWSSTAALTANLRFITRLGKNGTAIPGGVSEQVTNPGAFMSTAAATVVYLAEGDYVELIAFQSTAGAVALDTAISGMTLTKVGN
jgi:hypothetical protein